MLREKTSKLDFYSLGVVAANKPLNTPFIEVTPIEEFPMFDGEITDHKETETTTYNDAEGTPWSVKLDSTASIKAKWIPINDPNRRTAPDVRRGELVMIYRFSDRDDYWWNTLTNDDGKIRRLETVIWAFNNLTPENTKDDEESTYWATVSTHKKIVQVHTSKSDGEPYAYDIQINAKDGRIIITDDVGNYFELNSKETFIRLENADGTYAELNKNKINMYAADSVNILTPIVNISDNLVVGTDILNGGVVSSGNIHIAPAFVVGGNKIGGNKIN